MLIISKSNNHVRNAVRIIEIVVIVLVSSIYF